MKGSLKYSELRGLGLILFIYKVIKFEEQMTILDDIFGIIDYFWIEYAMEILAKICLIILTTIGIPRIS